MRNSLSDFKKRLKKKPAVRLSNSRLIITKWTRALLPDSRNGAGGPSGEGTRRGGADARLSPAARQLCERASDVTRPNISMVHLLNDIFKPFCLQNLCGIPEALSLFVRI